MRSAPEPSKSGGGPKREARAASQTRRRAGAPPSAPTELELTRAELQTTRTELEATRAELENRRSVLQDAWQELEISRDRYQDLYELIPQGCLTLDRGGRILEANLGAANLFRRTPDALARRSIWPFVPPASAGAFRRHLEDCLDGDGSAQIELRLRRANGEEFQALLQSRAIQRDRTRSTCQMTLIDDTTRWAAVQELRASEERYHELADSISDPFYALDEELRVVHLNAAAFRLSTVPVEGWTGRPLETFIPEPEIAAAVRPILQRVLRTGLAENFVTSWPTPEGRIFLGAKVYRSRNGLTILARDISARMAQEAERERLLRERGEARAEAERRAAETEEKGERLKETMGDLKRTNLELDRFVLVVAHDLSEPLRTISGFSQLVRARSRAGLDDQTARYLEKIVAGAERMQELLDSLLEYARLDQRNQHLAPTDLNDALGKALSNLSALVEATAPRLSQERLPTVRADEVQMTQVLQNLLANAMRFRRGEHPAIHVGAEERENDVIVRVSDDGIGIEPQHFEKIFQIFHRLQPRLGPPGLGAGLAIVRKIVESHRGRIWVESEPGKGSTFFFSLPKTG